MVDYKVKASLGGFRYPDGFLLTRREYDAALDDLFVGTAVRWSEIRAHAEGARIKEASYPHGGTCDAIGECPFRRVCLSEAA